MAGSTPSPRVGRAARLPILATIALLAFAEASGPLQAAPLPPISPFDVCGVIHSATWLQPKTLPAVPGMSGSAGHERHWSGRFVVVLGDVRGVGGEEMARVNGLLTTSSDGAAIALEPGELLLVLTEENPSRLVGMKSLCVTGFTVSGDEGGTWTRYGELTTFAGAHPKAE